MCKNHSVPLIALIFLFIFSCILKLALKDGKISLDFIEGILAGKKSSIFIFYNLRLPSLVAAVSCSVLVVISTYILQTISKNDLADPSALGYNNIAITVLAILFIYIPAARYLSFFQILTLSGLVIFIFALFMYYFSRTTANMIDGNILLLIGIGINTFFQMILSYIKTYAGNISEMLTVLMQGNFDHLELSTSITLSFITGGILIMFLFLVIPVRVLQLGNLTATSLGLNIKQTSFILFFIMSGAVAVSVMFGGTFPFIGFTSIHIMRHFYGGNFKLHFISSILCAAAIIILSDIVAHQMFSTILPTNIFLGLFGGTGFLIILLQRRAGEWQSV